MYDTYFFYLHISTTQHMSTRCNLLLLTSTHTSHKWKEAVGSTDGRLPPVAYLPNRSAANSVHRPLILPICRLALYILEMQTHIVT